MNGKAAIFSEDGGLISHRRCRLNIRIYASLAEVLTMSSGASFSSSSGRKKLY